MNGIATSERIRLDQLLVETGAFASRSRARDAILRGAVHIAGDRIEKPGQMVSSRRGDRTR